MVSTGVNMHLIITEKHNTAKRIAHILSDGGAAHKKVEGVDTYSFDGHVVVGLRGHVLGLDFPEKYRSWQATDARELIGAQVVHVPIQKSYIKALQKLSKNAAEITVATDFDREGELIGVEALNILEQAHPDMLKQAKVSRVRYSAITKNEIEHAFKNPVSVDRKLAASGEARQTIDLVWGAVLTRYISLAAGRLGNSFLSAGRVQSPTLALLVEREREVRSFVAKDYWEVEAELENGVVARCEHGRFDQKQEAEQVMEKLKGAATLKEFKNGTRTDKPPIPFNTTEFLASASSIGLSASNAMRIAESLYTNGYVSYPRTDNTVYPKEIDLKDVLSSLEGGELGRYAAELASRRLTPTRGKKETTDHPPIYPVSAAKRSELDAQEWKVYELITRRFFATLAPPCIVETQQARFSASGVMLRATGLKVADEGWRRYYIYSTVKEAPLPPMEQGKSYAIVEPRLLEKQTKPPSRYSQGALIRKMDELGIGTKSTRHETISKLYGRGYVAGNPLKPTQLSFSVIDTLEAYAPNITQPTMTRMLEEDMNKIAVGTVDEGCVIEESKDMLYEVFNQLEKNSSSISKSIREGLRKDAIIGSCPDCGNDLIMRRSRKGGRFIGCTGYPECTFTLPLPKFGRIVVTDKVCEEHGLSHLVVMGKKKRPWKLGCPMCSYENWKSTQQDSKQDSKTENDNTKNKAKPKVEGGLTSIKGIGAGYAKKLEDAAITSVEALKKLSPEKVSERTGIPLSRVKSWGVWR
ncbi:MAG: DNA topoisomerase I [Methermicoccaceae archaeon]